jgi:transcriptional regulator with XRE-family HTH domain
MVLHMELRKRGWHFVELARASRVSQAPLSAAVLGARISSRTLHRIAEALNRQPIVPSAEERILR